MDRNPEASWPSPVSPGSPSDQSETQETFLFIDYQDESSQAHAVAKRKQAFLKRQHYRSKREKRLQKLKASIPALPTYPPIWSWDRAMRAGGLDPFASFADSMTESMCYYFHYYRTQCSRSIYPFGATDMGALWLQQAIGQPALLHIILSTSAIHRAGRGSLAQTSPTAQKAQRDSLKFRAITLKQLQNMVQSPTEALLESTLLIVTHLLCVEAADANLEAVDCHLSALTRMVQLMGGLDALNPVTVSMIYCADFMSAALKISTPVFPMSVRWKSEVLGSSDIFPTMNDAAEPSMVGGRFFDSPWSKALHPTLRTIVRLFRRITHCLSTMGAAEIPVLNEWLAYAIHQLLSIAHDCMASDLHECLRLSVLVYSMVEIKTFGGLPYMSSVVTALRSRLRTGLPQIQRIAPDLSFWMLFVGGMASKGRASRAWFVAHLAEVAELLSLKEWDTALALLEGFLFIYQPACPQPGALWNEVKRQQALELDA